MPKGILARKLGMTQVFDEEGRAIPVTILQAGPCTVTQVKTEDRDRYSALQLGFESVSDKKLTKAEQGHAKKSGLETGGFRTLKEFRNTGLDVEVGQEVKADIFEAGELVKVSGVSKGKGFAGAIKRHGFGGGRATHGSHFHRAPGSLGATSTPSRVFRGKKMPGHAGARNRTLINVEVVRVNADQNLILVKGTVPGPRTAMVRLEAQE